MAKKNNKTKKSTVAPCFCSHCGQESNATPKMSHLGCNGVLGKPVHPSLKGRLVFEQGKWILGTGNTAIFLRICKLKNLKPIECLKELLIATGSELTVQNVLDNLESWLATPPIHQEEKEEKNPKLLSEETGSPDFQEEDFSDTRYELIQEESKAA